MNAKLLTQQARLIPTMIAITLASHSAAIGQITIDPVVRSMDPVPNRAAPFVFRGGPNMQLPVMNAVGEVVFRARSASSIDLSVGEAFGIYVRRPGEAVDVLVDNLINAGTPGFAVPTRTPSAHFTNFSTPLINDAGDVVFIANFIDPDAEASVVQAGIYATTTSGGGLTKIADSFDLMPGAGGVRFTAFTPSNATIQHLGGLALNNAGQVAFFGRNGLSTTGLFGSTVSGAAIVQLADNTITPTGLPFGTPQPFVAIEPKVSLNDVGQVAFNGQIPLNTPTGPIRGGVFRVPVTGASAPVSMAFQFEVAPDSGGATFNTGVSSQNPFSDQDIDESGRVVFISRLSTGVTGMYSTPAPAGGFSRIVDTQAGGLAVPGDIAGAEFDVLRIAQVNEAGQIGFFAEIRNSATTNNRGIYKADANTNALALVLDAASTAPGLSDPARVTEYANASAAINETGSMAFAGSGVDDLGNDMLGLYYLSGCGGQVARIVDSTTSLTDLGDDFSTPPDDGSLAFHQGFAALSGRYAAINDADQVVFLAQFDGVDCNVNVDTNCAFGVFVAEVPGGAGGQIDITCPADFVLECPADTSPNALGTADAVDSCSGASVPVSFSDTAIAGCGGAESITRTWTADDGAGNTASCDQLISVEDTLAPSLLGVPADMSVECDAVPAPATVTASDACDTSATAAFAEALSAGDCPDAFSLFRTWTASDGCGNSADESQTITVDDTTAPIITCPADQLSLECNADTSIAATGSATATDNCGSAAISSSDATSANCGSTVSITRTFTSGDDCGNQSTCDQLIATQDTTPPTIALSTNAISVVDADCSGDESVVLPTATASDDCGSVTVIDDAPIAFPAGESTEVTFTATDECANQSSDSVDVDVDFGSTIIVKAIRFVLGQGRHPSLSKEPIVDTEVCAYDRSNGSCADTMCPQFFGKFQCVVDNCEPASCATTDENGIAEIDVPPGKYYVIAEDLSQIFLPDPLGHVVGQVNCGETRFAHLRQIVRGDGRRFACLITRLTGSELLIIEPEEMIWDGTVQEYPFVFESIGDWNVTVTVEPPDGFVADEDSITEDVDNSDEAIQFTITEVGSDLVPTKTKFDVLHNGRKRVVQSRVGIKLTEKYARSRGFDPVTLRRQGLIKELRTGVAVRPRAEGPQNVGSR